jgi:DNA-nicking Smr family endonuclease
MPDNAAKSQRDGIEEFMYAVRAARKREMNDDSTNELPNDLPIDGVLDLHTFQPAEIGELVPAYLVECRERGILQVRIIHGKGIGNLKRGVVALLARLPEVASFSEASSHYGGTGATIVNLRPLSAS